jgi:hypothetical protein
MSGDCVDAFVESRMRGNAHVRFGGRRRGDHQPRGWHGASPSTLLWMYFDEPQHEGLG